MNKDVYQKIIELKNQGYTYKAIANELHVSKTKISKALHGTTKTGTKVPSREVPRKAVPSTMESQNELKTKYDKLYERVNNLASIISHMNVDLKTYNENVTTYLDTRDIDVKTWNKCINEFRLGITGLFGNISELCNTVLIQQNRIDTLQQRVESLQNLLESLQTRLNDGSNMNAQAEQKTRLETKFDMDEDGFCALKTKKW